MQEGLRLVEKEMGVDAIMLASQEITDDAGKFAIEITAAVDNTTSFTPQMDPELKPTQISDIDLPDDVAYAEDATSPLEEALMQHNVAPEIVSKITKAASALSGSDFSTFDALEMVVGKMVPFTSSSKSLPKGKIHLFIGPTGGGKTTTLCKLAVGKRIDGHKIGLITLDNQKVGAFEQINIFAEAMKEKSYLAQNGAELKEALAALKQKDYIFIDTAGLNPFDKGQIKKLQQKLKEAAINPVVHLVLPASMNPREMTALPAACAVLHPSNIIFTKIDETSYFGGLLNVAVMGGYNVCYVTDGTRVPEAIFELDAATLCQKLIEQPRLPWEIAS